MRELLVLGRHTLNDNYNSNNTKLYFSLNLLKDLDMKRSSSNTSSNGGLQRMTSFRLEQYIVVGKPASNSRNPHPADVRMKVHARSARAASETFLTKCQKQCPDSKRGIVLSVTRCSDHSSAMSNSAISTGSGSIGITVKCDTRTLYRE